MQHLDEVIAAEIYARDGIVVGVVKRGKEVLKPWVSSGVFFRTFFSLLKRKCKHSRVNPPVKNQRFLPAPFTQGGLWFQHHKHCPTKKSPPPKAVGMGENH
ncbi:MAG: hypothetical protein J6J01_01935 [Oscillospiraceae bacterium]|nr:hypothetical protein [Oscillospiraceae bacterium]